MKPFKGIVLFLIILSLFAFAFFGTQRISVYTISYDLGIEGEEITTESVAFQSKLHPPAEPTRKWYTFKGWQLDGEPFSFDKMPCKNIALTALWEPCTFIVTYNAGYEEGEITEVPTAYQDTVTPLAAPIRLGFTFIGWMEEGQPYTFGSMPARNITLVASWERTSYVITYDSCLDNVPLVQVEIQPHTAITPLPEPIRLGYRFLGWYEDNELFAFGLMPARDFTLSAKWDYDFIENVPAIIINTDDFAPIVSKEVYISSMIAVMNAPDASDNFTFKLAQIRGRGNSSWGLEKKPYRIKFDKKTKMFGSDYKAKSWTLIANHSDKTLVRNKLAYDLSREMDSLIYSPMAQIVEVYLNGVYQGVYMFCDHNQVNDGRVALPEADGGEASLDDVGFFMELNSISRLDPNEEGHEFFRIFGESSTVVELKSPDPDDFEDMSAYIDYIQAIAINASQAILSGDYNNFKDLIDIPSFIDYFLIEELFKNTDVGGLSVHLYKKPNDIKLYMGPIWDFDISAGNTNYIDYAPEGLYAQTANVWFAALMTDPTFFNMYVARWNELYNTKIEQLINSIMPLYEEYAIAFERNFQRWDVLGKYVWPNPDEVVAIDTCYLQFVYLKEYLQTRAEWLNEYYNN